MSTDQVIEYLDEVLGVHWVARYHNPKANLRIQLIDLIHERQSSEAINKLGNRLGQALVDEWTRAWTLIRSDAFPNSVSFEWIDLPIGGERLGANFSRVIVFGGDPARDSDALYLPRLSEIAMSAEAKRRAWQMMQERVQTWVNQWVDSDL